MKIAHICGPLVQSAGAERSAVELAYEMGRQGIDTRIYTPFIRENLFGDISKAIDIEEVRVPVLPVFRVYYDLFLTKRLISIASRWADVLILHSCHAISAYARRRFSVPCVPFYHIDKWDWSLFGSLRAIAPVYTCPLIALELRALRDVPLVFANSEDLAGTIRRHAPGTRVIPITIGVDTSRFYPKWGKDEGYVMMAGRFHPMNNFEIGIDVVANLGHELLIAGLVEDRFRYYYKYLQEIVSNNLDLKERVVFRTLPEAALIDRLQRCSLFLSPRNYNYLGHAALESMACGKPVVQLFHGSRLEDDPPVILCNRDPKQWRDAVDTLMKDSEYRAYLGRRSYEFVQEKHSLRASVYQVLRQLAKLLHGHEGIGLPDSTGNERRILYTNPRRGHLQVKQSIAEGKLPGAG